MLVIRNKQELERESKKIQKELMSSIELDIDTIETSYDSQSEQYGPLVVVMDEDERDELIKRYPIIEDLDAEIEMLVLKDTTQCVFRICYLLTDAGFIVYERRKSKNV